MNAQVCPNCNYPLLCHVRQGKPYWYCLHCHEETTYAVETKITEINQIESALQDSYRWFNSLIRASLEGVWVLNQDGETAFVNPQMAELLGYTIEEMQGKPAWCFVKLADRLQFIKRLDNRSQGLNEQYEIRLQHHNGNAVWVTISGHGVYDRQGQYIGTLGMVTNISDRKQAEEKVRELKDTLQTIIQASPLAIVALDNQGQVKLWNQSAENIFGWREQEVLGNVLPNLGEYPDRFSELLGATGENYFTDLETRYHRQDGSVIDISLSTAPLRDYQGGVIGSMGIAADITLVKQMQETLLQQAQRERLLGAIAQRIRQSLNIQEIIETTVLEVQKFLQADRVLTVHFQSPSQGNVVAQALGTGAISSMQGFMISDPLWNIANYAQEYQQGEILAISDIGQTELTDSSRQLLDFFQVKSLVIVPILQKYPENFPKRNYGTPLEPNLDPVPEAIIPNQPWGLLVVHQCQGLRQWQSAEINLLKQLATQVSIALQQGQLYEQAKLQAIRERTLNQITRAVRRTLHLKTIFSTAVWEIGNQLQSQRVEIWQYCATKQVWMNVSEYRGNLDAPVGLGREIGDRDSSVTIKLKKFKIVKNQVFAPALDQKDPAGNGACLLVPLHFSDRVWGALVLVMDARVYDWQEAQIELMIHIADQLAIAIQQSELYLQLQEANKKLQLLASTDGLTQVANRRYFDETLGKEWQRMTREKEPLSLLFTDIDWFKSYNDHYGHQAGDDCLRQVAQTITQVVNRPGDLVARYGGEEFVIILSNTDSQGAVQVAEKIRQAIADLHIVHPDSLVSPYLTVSLGIASVVPTGETTPDLIISQADQALYLAKNQGRDRFLVYDSSIDGFTD